MHSVIHNLIDLLTLNRVSDTKFVGKSQDLGFPKVFGGQVIGQALSAVAQTVPEGRSPHSLHSYFIRPGDANQEIEYEIEVVRDGGSFSVRRVIASQAQQTILIMTASFQKFEEGLSHQEPMPHVPGPENFKSELSLFQKHAHEIPAKVRDLLTADRPIEYRIVENQNPFRPRPGLAQRHMWIRAVSALPDCELVHQSMLAYTTDYGFLETSLQPHGISIGHPNLNIASLDHAIWFHRPFRLDDWLLYVADSPSASGARGFVRGKIFDKQGLLVASTAQEGLIRLRK